MSHLLTLLIALPAASALLLLLFPQRQTRAMQVFAIAASLVVFGLSLLLLRNPLVDAEGFLSRFSEKHAWIPALGITYRLGVDGISLFLVLLTTLLTPVSLLSAVRAVEHRAREFAIAFLLLESAMIGCFLALDLFLFFLFWEAMLIPMFLIIGVWGGPRRVYAAMKFFLFTQVGSALMLVAILYLAWQHSRVFGFWTFDYFALRDIMLPLRPQMFAFAAFTLAFAIKVPMFPLHTWLPDAHVEAPTAGSVILAGVLLKMGTYGYLRFSMGLFPHAAWKAGPTIAALAVVGILYGALTAWRQRDIKRLVAYSSVSHLGFVMLGLASAEPRAMAGAVLAMVNHGVSTGALFLLVGIVYERRHTRMMDDFGGLASVMPMFATVFVIVTLSSIGLPGTNGFVGEFFVLLGTFQSDFLPRAHWLVAFAGLGIVLGAVYMLGMVMRVFFGPVRDPRNEGLPDIGGREIATLAPLVALVFVIGLFPGFFTRRMGDSVRSAAVSFVQRVEQEDYLTRQGSLDEPRSFRRWMGERAGVLDATARFGGGGDTRPYDARTGPGEAAAAGPPVFRPSEPAAAGGAP